MRCCELSGLKLQGFWTADLWCQGAVTQRTLNRIHDIFWKRWLKEYLSTLQERATWVKPRRILVIEDLVSMADENNHCGKWSLRKVIDVFHGKDGYVRSAKVQTSLTVLTRPKTKLCFLEAESAHWIQETVYLIQRCNRHAIRANVNKPSDTNVCLIYDLKVLDLTFTISKTLQQTQFLTEQGRRN